MLASELPESKPDAVLEPCCNFISLVNWAMISDCAPPILAGRLSLGSVSPSMDFLEIDRGSKKAPLEVISTLLRLPLSKLK